MCLILDTNKYGDFLDPENRDMEPVRTWMRRGKGKMAYSPTEKMQSELNRHNKMREQMDRFRETDKLKLVPSDEVTKVMNGLRGLQSDDGHIIALATVAGVKLLVSGDANLHIDFKNIVGGHIYQTRRHQHLLKREICP